MVNPGQPLFDSLPSDWLPGASMMIRRQVFDAIGLMDENYFLYYEETDFCLQARRAGWSCWYVPQSRVMHIAGQSTGVTAETASPKRLPQYVFDSRRRYFVKNHGWLYAAMTDLSWLVGYGLWSVRRVIQRKPNTDPPCLFLDSLRNSVLLRF
jgi:N-acetylglucosaminyl-diphospho-decaprenol L-rhamnosyltransferase